MATPPFPLETVHPAPDAPARPGFAPSPYSFEFSGADGIRLTAYNSQPGTRIGLHYRMARRADPTHANAFTFEPTSDRAANVWEFELGEGYLLNATAFAAAGAPRRGQTFIRAQVIRGRGAAAVVLGTILQGYVLATQDRAWPGSPIEGSSEGDGHVTTVQTSNPFVGLEWSQMVPDGARWGLIAVAFGITTSAAVADRRPGVSVATDLGAPVLLSPSPGIVAASGSLSPFFSQGAAFAVALHPDFPMGFLPPSLRALPGWFIASSTQNLDAGDQLGAALITVREWLEV